MSTSPAYKCCFWQQVAINESVWAIWPPHFIIMPEIITVPSCLTTLFWHLEFKHHKFKHNCSIMLLFHYAYHKRLFSFLKKYFFPFLPRSFIWDDCYVTYCRNAHKHPADFTPSSTLHSEPVLLWLSGMLSQTLLVFLQRGKKNLHCEFRQIAGLFNNGCHRGSVHNLHMCTDAIWGCIFETLQLCASGSFLRSLVTWFVIIWKSLSSHPCITLLFVARLDEAELKFS